MKKQGLVAFTFVLLLVGRVFPADILQQVVVVTRHGVRSPTWTAEQLNQYSSRPWPDFGVPPGYLTPRGRELMKIMGSFYRDYYSQGGLLRESGCDSIYFWADTDQRTIESARALSEGILPGCKVDVNSKPQGTSDALFDATEAGVASADTELGLASLRGRIGPKLDTLFDTYRPQFEQLNKVLNPDGKAKRSVLNEPLILDAAKGSVALSGSLSTASTLTQVFLLEYANGMSGDQFAWGQLTRADLEQIHVLHTAYTDLMRKSPFLARIRGSNLLDHIVRTLKSSAEKKKVKGAVGPQGSKVVFLVGHDTNISNLAGMLDLSWIVPTFQPDDSPPGGALIFSLWKTPAGKNLIRVQFITQTLDQMHNADQLSAANPPVIADLFVPACSTAAPGYPCTWADFTRAASNAIESKFVEK